MNGNAVLDPSGLQPRRRGIAFLMVVVVLLIVIIVAAKTMVMNEIMIRRAERSSLRSRQLHTAIDRLSSIDFGPQSSTRLPIDEANNVWIEVSAADDQYRARWMSGETILEEVVRPRNRPQRDASTSESS